MPVDSTDCAFQESGHSRGPYEEEKEEKEEEEEEEEGLPGQNSRAAGVMEQQPRELAQTETMILNSRTVPSVEVSDDITEVTAVPSHLAKMLLFDSGTFNLKLDFCLPVLKKYIFLIIH